MTDVENVKTIFTDARGRKWPLAVHIGTAKIVKEKCGVDLLKFFSDPAEAQKAADPYTLAEIIYIISGAEKQNVTLEDFCASLIGDVADAASFALMESLILFFPSRKAQVLRRLIENIMQTENTMTKNAMEAVEAVISGQPSISSPVSSGSSPTV